jgi:putative iron-only hydrogenase system regulator
MPVRNKLAVIGVLVCNRGESACQVNNVLSRCGDIIVGRLGVPYKEKNIWVISIIVDASNDAITTLAATLSGIQGVTAKVAVVA